MDFATHAHPGSSVQRLPGFPATLATWAPGLINGGDATGVLIFDAGRAIHGGDLVARFYADDANALDWLGDFLLNPDITLMVGEKFVWGDDEEKFEDDMFYKSELTTLGSEVMEAY